MALGGHEGAGVIEAVGGGSSRFALGDHVVCSFLPACGPSRFCGQGMSNLCDLGALLVKDYLADKTFRYHRDGEDFDDDLPLDVVTLVGCGVATAWGTAVHAGAVRPG